MAHLGVLCFESAGHMNPMVALCKQLVNRGHRVTFFQRPEAEERITAHGLAFIPVGPRKTTCIGDAPDLTTIRALCHRVRRIAANMETFLRDAPALLEREKIDALIVDEVNLAGPTLAELLRLPYVVISTSVPHIFGWSAPRRISPRQTLSARAQNALLQVSAFRMRGPLRHSLDRYRRQAGLGPVRQGGKAFPPAAHITQLPACMDVTPRVLPDNFHYAGPFVDREAGPAVEFPWHRLDSRPLVYISLGTTRKGDVTAFRMAAEACDHLNLQLVVSLGGRRDSDVLGNLPCNTIVVREAPQREVIKRSKVVITHGGLNTVLESLMEGKPMLVIPKFFDQPSVAVRLELLGVAKVLREDLVSAEKIRHVLSEILSDPRYEEAACRVRQKVVAARGAELAAKIIDGCLTKGRCDASA